jgi:hypothetical protein
MESLASLEKKLEDLSFNQYNWKYSQVIEDKIFSDLIYFLKGFVKIASLMKKGKDQEQYHLLLNVECKKLNKNMTE